MKAGAEPTDGKRFGGVLRGRLDLVGGSVLDLPNAQLPRWRPGPMSRASTTTGASSRI